MGYKLNHGILYLEEIYTAIFHCENIRDSAMALLMLSSNMDSDFLSVLTVGDLLDACDDYLDDKNDINELMGLDSWSVVPCWRNVANQKILSFNTPEATFHILLYLNKRKSSGEELTSSSPLFIGKNHSPMKPKSIRNRFSNVELNFHVDFSQTSLLETFRFVCENYCENEDLKKLLLMNDVETNSLYNKTNSELRYYYKPLIPFLTAKLFDNQKVRSDYALDTDSIISNYYEEYIKHRDVEYDFKDGLEIKKIAKSNFELYEGRELTFQQLEIIYKYAECKFLIQNEPLFENDYSWSELSEKWSNDEECIKWMYDFFKNSGMLEILEISEEKTKKEIIKQSVEVGAILKSLTRLGFLTIFNELFKSVFLDDSYSLFHTFN